MTMDAVLATIVDGGRRVLLKIQTDQKIVISTLI